MIQLFNGDCLEAMRGMKDNEFDLAIVDPPYGLAEKITSGGTWASKYNNQDHYWDKSIPPKQYFLELQRISRNQIIWGGNYFLEYLGNTRCLLVWDKLSHMPTMADCEFAWTSFDQNSKIYKHPRNTNDKRIHICQKPVALYTWLLDKYAKEGDKILDTHLGSGSIAIACHNLGFDLVGYELDEDYFQAAKKRLEEHQKQLRLF